MRSTASDMSEPTSSQRRPSVLSVFGIITTRIGGIESHARELSAQLDRHGWDSLLYFDNDAPENVRQYLAAPNVTIGQLHQAAYLKWSAMRKMTAVIHRLRPTILHMHY